MSYLTPYPLYSEKHMWDVLKQEHNCNLNIAEKDSCKFIKDTIIVGNADFYFSCLELLKKSKNRVIELTFCDVIHSKNKNFMDNINLSDEIFTIVGNSGDIDVLFSGDFNFQSKHELDLNSGNTIAFLFDKNVPDKPVGMVVPSSTNIVEKNKESGRAPFFIKTVDIENSRSGKKDQKKIIAINLRFSNEEYLMDFMNVHPSDRVIKILVRNGYYGLDKVIKSAERQLDILSDQDSLLHALYGKSIGEPLQTSYGSDPFASTMSSSKGGMKSVTKYSLNPDATSIPTCRTAPEVLRFDLAQQSAIEGILNDSQPLTLVQGPPGSAKTTVTAAAIKQMMENGRRVMAVCYTQHAVDNLCDAVATMCTKSFLPLWRPEGKLLKKWIQVEPMKWPRSARGVKDVKEMRDSSIESLKEILQRLIEPLYMKGRVRRARQNSEWTEVVDTGPDPYQAFIQAWLLQEKPEGAVASGQYGNDSRWSIPLKERLRHFHHDILGINRESVSEHFRAITSHVAALDKLTALGTMELSDKQCPFVAGTTQWAAKNIDKLSAAGYDVVVIEEAAELREMHALACLPRTAKKLVLVGDHKQLRPKVETYELTQEANKGFYHDVSMFERLFEFHNEQIEAGKIITPWCFTLRRQFRMPPSLRIFCNLLGYNDLVSGRKESDFPVAPMTGSKAAQILLIREGRESLLKLHPDHDGTEVHHHVHSKEVRGLRKAFFHHQYPEEGSNGDESHDMVLGSRRNIGEAALVVLRALVLLRSGIPPSDITILSPYLGQVRVLQRLLVACGLKPALEARTSVDIFKEGDEVLSESPEEQIQRLTLEQANLATDGTDLGGQGIRPPTELWESPGTIEELLKTFKEKSKGVVPFNHGKISSDNGIKLSTVDNYQGEENKHILLSLVRSNKDYERLKKSGIGFLKNPNRLIVALSRQQISLTIFGNARCLTQASIWKIICNEFIESNTNFTAYPFLCPAHLENSGDREFRNLLADENRKCRLLLPGCGEVCNKALPCEHRCALGCHEGRDCPPCSERVPVPSRLLQCKHEPTVHCGVPVDENELAKSRRAVQAALEKSKGPPQTTRYLCTEKVRIQCRFCLKNIEYPCNDGARRVPECHVCRRERELEEKRQKEEEELRELQKAEEGKQAMYQHYYEVHGTMHPEEVAALKKLNSFADAGKANIQKNEMNSNNKKVKDKTSNKEKVKEEENENLKKESAHSSNLSVPPNVSTSTASDNPSVSGYHAFDPDSEPDLE